MNTKTIFNQVLLSQKYVKVWSIASLCLLVLLLAACGTTPETITEETVPVTEAEVDVEPTNTPIPPADPPISPTERPTKTPLPDVAVEDIYGQWGHILFSLELYPDGTYLLLWPSEPDFENPREYGTYQLDGSVITFQPERYEATASPTIGECIEGKAYTYAASFSDGDTRFIKLVEQGTDPCGWRAGHWNSEPIWQLMEKYSAE